MKYHIVSGGDLDKFIDQVNDYLNRGWKPLGGVRTVDHSIQIYFYQTLVLEEPTYGEKEFQLQKETNPVLRN